MTQYDSDFKILAANKPAALDAIQRLAGRETITDSTGRHFSWVSTDDFLRADTLEEALKAWRWGTETDDDGNTIGISFQGQKLGDDALLFEAIAPYVEDGSYIDMQGEDGSIWRWIFENGKVEDLSGTTIFSPTEVPHFTILITEHGNGPTATIHRTRAGAEAALLFCVREFWEDEMGEEIMPEDPKEAVRMYFESVENEGYTIVEDATVYE